MLLTVRSFIYLVISIGFFAAFDAIYDRCENDGVVKEIEKSVACR